jgi:hypothetical protein
MIMESWFRTWLKQQVNELLVSIGVSLFYSTFIWNIHTYKLVASKMLPAVCFQSLEKTE